MREIIDIEFGSAAAGEILVLELDDEKNAGVSTFAPEVDVYIKARTVLTVVTKGSTAGNVTINQLGVRDEHTEELTFVNEVSASLQYDPTRIVSHRWLGRGLGNATFNGVVVSVPVAGYGILEVVYEAAFTRLKLAGVSEAGKVLVWAVDSSDKVGTLVIEFGEEGETQKSVYIVVKDFCSDLPVAGAAVLVDGVYKGVTGADGRLYVGTLLSGSYHTLLTTATSYKDSNVDALANDEFTVP